jgi:hypothetical protein
MIKSSFLLGSILPNFALWDLNYSALFKPMDRVEIVTLCQQERRIHGAQQRPFVTKTDECRERARCEAQRQHLDSPRFQDYRTASRRPCVCLDTHEP